jgi:hypothetical protein
MNTSKISDWLCEGKVNKAFTKLYSLFPKAEKYILQNSGSKAEALDVFQEALIILHQKHKVDQSVNIEGFVINTCHFLWQNELRKKKIRMGDSEPLDYLIQDNDMEAILEKENGEINLLHQRGCLSNPLTILNAFRTYYQTILGLIGRQEWQLLGILL